MGLISSGIDRVAAFGLACGIADDGRCFEEAGSVLVRWFSEHDDKLHQIYVDGELAAVTGNCCERQVVVRLGTRNCDSARIEVYAVEDCDAYTDFSGQLGEDGHSCRIKLRMLREAGLAFLGKARVYSNDGAGAVDYQEQVNLDDIRLWPGWQDKDGWGLSKFGVADFGYDCANAAGFGMGEFGTGEFGFDVDAVEWISGEVESGEYIFGVETVNDKGQVCSVGEVGPICVIRGSRSCEGLEVKSHDAGSNVLVLESK